MKFKTARQRQEWNGGDLTPRLRSLVLFTESLLKQHGIELTITCFMRTEKEQAWLYRRRKRKPRSVHEFGRGADVRTRDWPEGLAIEIRDKVNETFRYDASRPALKSAIWHDVGAGEHLHLQVSAGNAWRG